MLVKIRYRAVMAAFSIGILILALSLDSVHVAKLRAVLEIGIVLCAVGAVTARAFARREDQRARKRNRPS